MAIVGGGGGAGGSYTYIASNDPAFVSLNANHGGAGQGGFGGSGTGSVGATGNGYNQIVTTIHIGLMTGTVVLVVVEPLVERRTNPVTAVALVGALISGLLSLGLVLRAMVNSQPLV